MKLRESIENPNSRRTGKVSLAEHADPKIIPFPTWPTLRPLCPKIGTSLSTESLIETSGTRLLVTLIRLPEEAQKVVREVPVAWWSHYQTSSSHLRGKVASAVVWEANCLNLLGTDRLRLLAQVRRSARG